jgi:hypothetical protein
MRNEGLNVDKLIELEVAKQVAIALNSTDVKSLIKQQIDVFIQTKLPDVVADALESKSQEVIDDIIRFDEGIYHEEVEKKMVKIVGDIFDLGFNAFIKK